MISVYIDHRESALKEYLTHLDVKYENLPYGDIIIDIDGKHLGVFERKTLSDLAASIKDGRYKNQKIKLLESTPDNALYYIIEGPIDFSLSNINVISNGISNKIMVSCIINMMIRDNIKIFFTKNIMETIDLITNIVERIKADPIKYNKITNKDIEPVIKKVKSINLSKEKCFEHILCQIPGISNKTAHAVCQKYPTMILMYESLGKLSYEEKLKVLKEIMLEDNNGKNRKISEKVLKNIIEYIF